MVGKTLRILQRSCTGSAVSSTQPRAAGPARPPRKTFRRRRKRSLTSPLRSPLRLRLRLAPALRRTRAPPHRPPSPSPPSAGLRRRRRPAPTAPRRGSRPSRRTHLLPCRGRPPGQARGGSCWRPCAADGEFTGCRPPLPVRPPRPCRAGTSPATRAARWGFGPCPASRRDLCPVAGGAGKGSLLAPQDLRRAADCARAGKPVRLGHGHSPRFRGSAVRAGRSW